jgi:hypothetical protein
MTRARDVSNIDGLLTTKGDIYAATGAGVVVRQGVGANGQVLTADSAEADGLKWATLPAAGSMTLLSTTTLSGSSILIDSIPSTYTNLVLVMKDVATNASGFDCSIRFNGLSTSIYDGGYINFVSGSISTMDVGTGTAIKMFQANSSSTNPIYSMTTIPRYSSSDARKYMTSTVSKQGSSTFITNAGCVTLSSAISSITFVVVSTTYTSGTVYLYGVN